MKTAIKILQNELNDWKAEYTSEKEYFKGFEDDPVAINSFTLCKIKITELKEAIKILKNK